MFLLTLLIASCYGWGNNNDGFGDIFGCFMTACDKPDGEPEYVGHVGGVHGGSGETINDGTCLVQDCVDYGFNRAVCEAEDGWNCVPFLESAKRCDEDDADSCEKNARKWVGNGNCDVQNCGNCPGYWTSGIFDDGDCTESEMKAGVAADYKPPPPEYTASKTRAICASSYYLKGFKWTSKDECEKACDERSGCDTFCWSNKSPHWDCLTYTGCDRTDSKFSDGNPTSSYNCWKKPGQAEETAMMSNVADAETVDSMPVVLHGFAALGLGVILFGSFKFYCSK